MALIGRGRVARAGREPSGSELRARDPDEQLFLAQLPGGPLDYRLRHSVRARNVRVTISPRRGVVVTVPARRGVDRGRVEAFLGERETWLRGHLARQAEKASRIAARGPLVDGSLVLFRGEEHRLQVVPPPALGGPGPCPHPRRSSVERIGGESEDLLLVHLAARDPRSVGAVLEAWCRVRAREAIERVISNHAPALGVTPGRITIRDTRSRWGSASRRGHLSFAWRLILAPPDALETVVVHELAHLRVFGHGPDFWAIVASRKPDHRTWRRWLRDHADLLHAAFARE